MYHCDDCEFSTLKGKVLAKVEGLTAGSDEVTFTTVDGATYRLYHGQDCCERVRIESVVGDVEDLIGHEILMAEESTSRENPADAPEIEYQDSYTWTFYKLATIKGYVDIRWYGESNGYYSERVDFVKVV